MDLNPCETTSMLPSFSELTRDEPSPDGSTSNGASSPQVNPSSSFYFIHFLFLFFSPSNRIFQLLIAQIRPFGLFSSAIDWNLWTLFFNLPLPLHLMYNSWCYWLFRWIMLILISTQSSQLIWITNSIALSWLTELTLCLLTGKRTFFFLGNLFRHWIRILNKYQFWTGFHDFLFCFIDGRKKNGVIKSCEPGTEKFAS